MSSLKARKVSILAFLIVAIAAFTAGVALAITITPITKTILPYAEKYVTDTKTTIVSQGLDVAGSTVSKTTDAQSSPGMDVTSTSPTVYANDITAGNLVFKFQFKEKDVNTLTGGEVYRIRVWADNVLKAEIYIQQLSTAVEGTAVEGVTVWVDVGTDVSSITVVAEQIAP